MLGSLLEIALCTGDIRASCDFYEQLGFGTAVTGDIWTHHYGVMACGGLCLGLHEQRQPSPSVVFTRENVAALARELDTLGIPVLNARLGSEEFHELSLRDPSGLVLRVLEARSFSPPPAPPALTTLGRFESLSLPIRDVATAEAFWQRLGISTPPVAYHAPRLHDEPLLQFRHPDLAQAQSVLSGLGIDCAPGLGGFAPPDHLLLTSPEGQPIALLA
jgi:catechol 2,3-dioxygenase-like lactoylglutathione lyase family enzyme